MHLEAVLERFDVLTGLTTEEVASWRVLCEDALQRIRSKCRDEVDPAEHSGVLCPAAAALAFYWYALGRDVADGEDFTAGDVKVSGRHGLAAAKELWESARKYIANLLRDDGFCFRTTGKRRCAYEAG